MHSLRITRRDDGIAVVTFDLPGTAVNVLSRAVLDDFRSAVDEIERDDRIRGVVIISGKSDNFIAGADLKEIRAITDPAEASAFVREGHKLLDRVALSRKPFVAAIQGAALGGGLEIALACDYRIAADHPRTILGLPEVMVGLIPAEGGTQRLPRLVGLERALPMMLLGQRLRARRAYRAGVVDALVQPEALLDAAIKVAWNIAGGEMSTKRHLGFKQRLYQLSPVRGFVMKRASEGVRRNTRGLYPAPVAIIDCVERGLARGFKAGQEREIEQFGKLVVSPQAKNLLWLFEATNGMKKPAGDAEPKAVKHVGVVGGGFMGEGIASVSLPLASVIVKDVSDAALQKLESSIDRSLGKRFESGSIDDEERETQRQRLRITTNSAELAGADLVIEAVFEKLELKRQVLAEIEEVVDADAVIASNTSALPIASIAEHAQHRDRVVGMHYFSPVTKMPLLEIIAPAEASPRAIATAQAFGIAQGKTTIVVKDGPGFYTTRILAPFLNEAMHLLEEGAEIVAVDRALKNFGFPVGPITLLDEVGIDVGAHVSRDLGTAFAARDLQPSQALQKIAAAGHAGRKNGRGFFVYSKKKKQVNVAIYQFLGGERKPMAEEEIRDRCALMMIGEAIRCLEEGVLSSSRDGDVGAVLGLGFPPFRGGPFHYADSAGEKLLDRFEEIASRVGPRFAPPEMLVELVRSKRCFYPA